MSNRKFRSTANVFQNAHFNYRPEPEPIQLTNQYHFCDWVREGHVPYLEKFTISDDKSSKDLGLNNNHYTCNSKYLLGTKDGKE